MKNLLRLMVIKVGQKRDVIKYKSHQGKTADDSSCEGYTWWESVNPKETEGKNGRPWNLHDLQGEPKLNEQP